MKNIKTAGGPKCTTSSEPMIVQEEEPGKGGKKRAERFALPDKGCQGKRVSKSIYKVKLFVDSPPRLIRILRTRDAFRTKTLYDSVTYN